MFHLKTPAFITTRVKIENGKITHSLQPVDLYDVITFRKINERKIGIRKKSGFKIPTNDLNPVYKAAVALRNLKPNKLGVEINIEKNIPTFSGMNSQMGNAAGALIALNRMWKFGLSQKELLKLAETVDHRIAGILKQHFSPKKKSIQKVILVRPKNIVIDKGWLIKKSGNLKKMKGNSFEKTAFRYFPDMKELTEVLRKKGGDECGMSGFGSMLFGFFREKIDQKKTRQILDPKSDFLWFGKTCNGVFKLLE